MDPQENRPETETRSDASGRVRYAVVGLGHIAQAAVLPAFRHAAQNSELAALISSNPAKLKKLGRKYKIAHMGGYEGYDDIINSGAIDAVYIALPNHLHCEYATRAAEAGVHVLCEKPMAVSETECHKMISAAAASDVQLMIAYRLHFEACNVEAIDIVRSGQIGEPRFFHSAFTMQVKDQNIRIRRDLGGGTLYDIGVYCINAARNLFRDEPSEVFCTTARSPDPRFEEVEEMATGLLRFPHDRQACFTCSFGAADVSAYRIVGTEGDLVVEPAYEYVGKLGYRLTIDGKTRKKVFPKGDQFAPELLHFSECVRAGREPTPSGATGLADVRIIEALYRSEFENRPLQIEPVQQPGRPDSAEEIKRPAVERQELIHAESASQ